MAQQSTQIGVVEWKPGTKCDFYDRDTFQWVEAEVIGSFSDDKREWLKVRCGQKDHNVVKGDPTLRKRAVNVIPGHHLKQLQDAASQLPNIAPILQSILPSSSGQGLYEHSSDRMTWFKVVNCVNNELFPVLSIALKKCVDEKLSEDNNFKMEDFGDDAVDDILERLKGERTMNNKEMKYLKELLQRAVDSPQQNSDVTGNVMEKCKDISPEWPGLTVSILQDIYSVHKALIFGRLQRADYSPTEFMNDLKKAESQTFKHDICSQHLTKKEPRLALSFYPEYMINDDLFEVMACQYAVSSVVREMKETSERLSIFSVVVPVAICSRYDVAVPYQSTITNLDAYLQEVATSGFCFSTSIDFEVTNVMKMAETIKSLTSYLKVNDEEFQFIAIVFHRERANEFDRTRISVFGYEDVSKVRELYLNYFISFEFQVSPTRVISNDDVDNVVRCWMNFGVGQRLRFYPEYSVWIIPYLFIRSTRITAYKLLDRIYGDDYKHGWRVSLDDPIFNKYYHIITEHEHISNNYNRDEVDVKQRDVQKLLRDYLDEKLRWGTAVKLNRFVSYQAYDSEAILEDMEDVNDSNISALDDLEFGDRSNVKFAVLRFQNMECKTDSVRDLPDCEHVHVLVENLRKFQECGLVVDALNVIQFDVDSVITAFDHIIKVHGFLSDSEKKLKIQQFFADQVACRVGAECAILKLHGERLRERENVEEKRYEPVDEVDTLCEVTADALNSVHCYVLHQKTDLYRMLSGRDSDYSSRFSTAVDDEEQKEDTEEVKDDGVEEELQSRGINFGLNVLQWLPFGEEPEFGTLGEEMVENPDSTIDAHIFQQYLMICLAKIAETNYTVNEMVSLKFYTDTNEMQSQLRKAHWTAASAKVRKSHYQWAMGLYRAHLYHDKPIPTATGSTTKPCRLFHGLNQLFTVSREMPVYFGPFSTTIARTVASTFCNEQGLIWLIQSSYVNPLKIVVGINVDWISGFKHEKEVLLYNQCLPIQETETFDDDSNILMNHLVGSLISRESPIIKKNAFYKQLGIGLDAKWLHSICDHKKLFEKTACSELRVVDRLVKELNMVSPNMAVKLWNTKHDDKSELEYLVDNLKATQLSDHHEVMTSKFKMLHFSPLLNWTWLRFTGNVNAGCIKETKYKTNVKSITSTTSSVKGRVTNIQVKNSKLFGHRFLDLQSFDEQQDVKGAISEFVDYLRMDRYGFLFVDNIPKIHHQFKMGDDVKYNDDSMGKICELAEGKICIEIGDEKRWIERSLIPISLTLIFPNQQDIAKYAFVLVAGEDTDRTNVKQYSFPNITRFEIPYSSMISEQSDVQCYGIYAKPKGTDIPLIKIKSIEYPPNDAVESVKSADSFSQSNTESIVTHLLMTLKERDSEIRDEKAFLKSLGLDWDIHSEWTGYVTDHPQLFDVTSYRRKLVIERLIVEMNLLSVEWVRRITKQTKNGKPLLEWLVEDRKISRLLDHYRFMTSKFKILHFSPLLNRSWLKIERNNKMKELDMGNEDSSSKETEYKVNGEIFGTTSFCVKGQVSRIEVKNSKLFGKRFADLQRFQDEPDEEEQKGNHDEFVDALAVDRYGFVFGDNVAEESEGTVFRHGRDIGKYEFIVSEGVDDGAPNLSKAKKFTFSDIKQFEIPCSSMKGHISHDISVGVYAKPKGIDVPLSKIKSIEYSPINVEEVVISNTESMVHHLMATLKATRTEIRDETTFLDSFGLYLDDRSKWMHLIFDHFMLFEVSRYRGKLVIERLIVELNMLCTEWLHVMLEQKKDDKPLLEWLVEERKVFRLLDHYLVMTSKFKIVKYSKLMNCSWLKLQKNTKMDNIFDHEPRVKETEYFVNGEISISLNDSIDGVARNVSFRDSDLFGDCKLTLQRFAENDNVKETATASVFVNSLDFDEFGVISVNMGIGRKVKVDLNGQWVRGVVSRMTAENVCVKTGTDMLSFYWIQREHLLSKIKCLSFESEREISEYEFAVRAGQKHDADDKSNLKMFTFDNVSEFRILVDSVTAKSVTVNAFHIYAKPKKTSVDYHHIKTVEREFEPWHFPRYALDVQEPVCIDEVVAVKPFSDSAKCGGKFEAVIMSGIIISKSGAINASGCGLQESSQHSNDEFLKFGKFVGDSEREVDSKNDLKARGAGGGIISLFTTGNVVNEGALLGTATDDAVFSGGSVYVVAEAVFENKGKIDCGKDGMVRIECARFINSGLMTPSPNVVMVSDDSINALYRNGIINGKEELIKLEVVSNRGHVSGNNIEYVLRENGYTDYYKNSSSHGPVNEDWFIFRVKSERRFIPKRIVVMNSCNAYAIKKISIAGSDVNYNGEFEFAEWMELGDIRRRRDSEMQTLPVDEMAGYVAWQKAFTSFRITVLENHGANYNGLCEFRMYGVYC